MCRSIHTLRHADQPVSENEIHEAALQYVRKVSGYHHPSKANETAFWAAVNEVSSSTSKLLANLEQRSKVSLRNSTVDIRSE